MTIPTYTPGTLVTVDNAIQWLGGDDWVYHDGIGVVIKRLDPLDTVHPYYSVLMHRKLARVNVCSMMAIPQS